MFSIINNGKIYHFLAGHFEELVFNELNRAPGRLVLWQRELDHARVLRTHCSPIVVLNRPLRLSLLLELLQVFINEVILDVTFQGLHFILGQVRLALNGNSIFYSLAAVELLSADHQQLLRVSKRLVFLQEGRVRALEEHLGQVELVELAVAFVAGHGGQDLGVVELELVRDGSLHILAIAHWLVSWAVNIFKELKSLLIEFYCIPMAQPSM